MALATQCPHCHTTFKVAHDQLKLRSGLVRCGACKQIFNGIENLVPPDQASAGSATPEKHSPQPATAVPPTIAPEPATPPAVTPVATPQATPPASPGIGQSAADALEFIPVDDPETRTRIWAPEPDPGPSPAAKRRPATEPEETDEDPLTRMTLVDFSLFDEDVAQAAASAHAEEMPQQVRQSDEIWPDTRDVPLETDTPGGPDTSASPSVPPQDDAANLSADAPVHAFATETPADAALADAPEFISSPAPDTVTPDETAAAVTSAASAAATDATDTAQASALTVVVPEYDEDDMATSSPMPEDDVEEPAFVTQERQRQRRRRVLRIFMAVASVLLFAAALAQGAYAFRSQLAARFPQTRPMLSHMCDLAGCQVLLPAQIDQVSIESNELQAHSTNKNVFTLSLLLHNHSTVPQAWPHIELTLNDNDGKALVRRVLAPREYLPSDKNPADGIAARSEQPVKASFELNQLQASDYRVYLFYP
ncbi:MAG TPA: hypothetical protein DHV59_05815 [Oxalobacteraceae bacterium]|nr:hypothetical protein [Oxalobacteraceae bacterium]